MSHNGKHSAALTPNESASAAVVETEGPLATGQRFRPIALASLTVVLLALCGWLAMPFLSVLAWAVALAIVAWPLHVWMRTRVAPAGLAAAATMTIVLIAIIVPGLFVAYQLAHEVGRAGERLGADTVNVTLRSRIAEVPALQGVAAWMDRVNLDLDEELKKLIRSFVAQPASLLQGSVVAIIYFVLTLFVLYHFLKDSAALRQRVRRLLPMTREECDRVFSSAADSVRANVYATVITSLIDGATGALLFWAIGLPSPALWGVVIFVASVLPILGTFIVWVPATIYLLIVNQWLGAVAMITWGVGTAILIDSLLYVRLAGNRMRLHQVPVLLAFLGGLALFGPSGMILGPAILAVTVAVLDVWHCRADSTQETATEAGSLPSGQSTEEGCAIPNLATAHDSRPKGARKVSVT